MERCQLVRGICLWGCLLTEVQFPLLMSAHKSHGARTFLHIKITTLSEKKKGIQCAHGWACNTCILPYQEREVS